MCWPDIYIYVFQDWIIIGLLTWYLYFGSELLKLYWTNYLLIYKYILEVKYYRCSELFTCIFLGLKYYRWSDLIYVYILRAKYYSFSNQIYIYWERSIIGGLTWYICIFWERSIMVVLTWYIYFGSEVL